MMEKKETLKDKRKKLINDLDKNILKCYREHTYPGGVIDMFEVLLNKQDKDFIKRVKEDVREYFNGEDEDVLYVFKILNKRSGFKEEGGGE